MKSTALRFAPLAQCLLLVAVPAALSAQGTMVARTPTDVADSAALARTHYRSARESLSRGDTAGALNALLAAASSFPQQPAYTISLFSLAAKSHSNPMLVRAMAMANNAGIALPREADSSAAMTSARSASATLYAKQRELSGHFSASTAFRTIADKRLFPEGLAYDARSGTVYLSSLHRRGILSVSRSGVERMLTPELPDNLGGLYGIVVDTIRNVIWAASAQSPSTKSLNVADSTLSALVEFDLATGAVRKRYALRGSALAPSPGDIALGRNGDVFVGDGQAGVIWWLKSGEQQVRMLQHKLLRSPQGMVLSDDGRTMWVADYSHGLLKIELATGATARVADFPGVSTVGIDGLVRHGTTFIGVQNGQEPAQVLQFTLNAAGTRIVSARALDRSRIAVSPTGGVMLGDDFVYIANSLWDRVGLDGTLPESAERAPVLLRIPMGAAGRTTRRY